MNGIDVYNTDFALRLETEAELNLQMVYSVLILVTSIFLEDICFIFFLSWFHLWRPYFDS